MTELEVSCHGEQSREILAKAKERRGLAFLKKKVNDRLKIILDSARHTKLQDAILHLVEVDQSTTSTSNTLRFMKNGSTNSRRQNNTFNNSQPRFSQPNLNNNRVRNFYPQNNNSTRPSYHNQQNMRNRNRYRNNNNYNNYDNRSRYVTNNDRQRYNNNANNGNGNGNDNNTNRYNNNADNNRILTLGNELPTEGEADPSEGIH